MLLNSLITEILYERRLTHQECQYKNFMAIFYDFQIVSNDYE